MIRLLSSRQLRYPVSKILTSSVTTSTRTMSISKIQESDYAEWADQWRQYLAFYKTELPESQYKNTFSRIIAKDGDLDGFVIRHEEGGKIVGLTHYLTHQNAWSDKHVCYLNDLFVDASTRGKGFGRKLIMAVFDAAKDLGCSRVYWMTQHENTTARKLYDTLAKTEFTVYRMAPFADKE